MNDLNFTVRAMDFGMKAPLRASSIPEFDFAYILTQPGFVAFRLLELLDKESADYRHVSRFLELWEDNQSVAAVEHLSEHVGECPFLSILYACVHTQDGDEKTAEESLKILMNYLMSRPATPLEMLVLSLYIEWTLTYIPSVLSVAKLVMELMENDVEDFMCRLQCARFMVYMDHAEEAKNHYINLISADAQTQSDEYIQALARREIRSILTEDIDEIIGILDNLDEKYLMSMFS